MVLARFLCDGASESMFLDKRGKPITWSTWVKECLKPLLARNWSLLPQRLGAWDDEKAKFRAPDKLGSAEVQDAFVGARDANGIRITTIHDVKGESLDAVLLVSSRDRRSDGGHVSHWLADACSEHARFAYVACSRARDLLVIAVPRDDKKSIKTLGDAGAVEEHPPDLA